MKKNQELENIFKSKCDNGNFEFSYSSLNRLKFSPSLFYKDYILKEREVRTDKHLIEGKLIHLLLLQPEEFDNNFALVPGKIPSDAVRRVLNEIKDTADKEDLEDLEPNIITALKHQNLYQSIKDDSKRLSKILTDDNKEYFKFLLNSNGKDIIDQDIYKKCNDSVELIKENKSVMEALASNETDFELDDTESFVEKALSCKLQNYDFGLKGIIDKYIIDHKNKTIRIIDFKTTGKSVTEFAETVEFYNYWLQAAIYSVLALKNAGNKGKDYKINFTFIVIDKYNQIYSFPVRPNTMDSWYAGLEQALDVAKYHIDNMNFDLPYEFLVNEVTL
mgnify:FL=1|tara:strand:+ start:827 stop:1825 length:999 start_codon:yes stop_codon:yes gene_type:complete